MLLQRLVYQHPYRSGCLTLRIHSSSIWGTQMPVSVFTPCLSADDQLMPCSTRKAQADVNAIEPQFGVWEIEQLESSMANSDSWPRQAS